MTLVGPFEQVLRPKCAEKNSGITQLLQINNNNLFDNKIIILRLDGSLDIVRISDSINYVGFLKPHNLPITKFCYVKDYLLTTSQDCLLKAIRIEPLGVAFVSSDHGESQISAICVDMENPTSAATGSNDGLICLFNLFTGQCEHRLCYSSEFSILFIQLVNNFLISVSTDQMLCVWSRARGHLINLIPLKNPRISPNSPQSSLKSWIIEKFRYHSKKNKNRELNDVSIFPESICLYSKNLLVTGGISCVYFWSIIKGNLIKKINIKKFDVTKNGNFFVTKIILIKNESTRNRFLLVKDNSESISLLNIPNSLVHGSE